MSDTVHEYVHDVQEALEDGLRQRGESTKNLPPAAEVAHLVLDLLAHRADDNELADVVGPVWSGAKVRQELGLASKQALDSRRSTGSILGLKVAGPGGARFYPVSQFRRQGDRVEVKPALALLFRRLRDFDPWAVAVLLRTPASELGGATPLEWERNGGSDEQLQILAAHVAREWGHDDWDHR